MRVFGRDCEVRTPLPSALVAARVELVYYPQARRM